MIYVFQLDLILTYNVIYQLGKISLNYWAYIMMHWIVYVLLILAAIVTLFKSFLEKRESDQKRTGWKLGLLISVIFLIIKIIDTPHKQLTTDDIKVATKEAYLEGNDVMDSLEQSNSLANEENQFFHQIGSEYAIYFSEIAKAEFKKVQVLIKIGEYDSSLFLLKRSLVVFGEDSLNKASTLFLMGICYHFNDELVLALHNYDSSLVYNFESAEAWCSRGAVLGQLKRYQDALNSCEKAIVLRHGFAEAWLNRGIVLKNMGRYDEALQSHDSALAYNHKLPDAWYNKGVTLGELNRYQEALQNYDSALVYLRNDAAAWCNRGVALNMLGYYQEALHSQDSALAYKPDFGEPWYNKAIVYRKLGRYQESLQSYNNYLKYKHDDATAWHDKGGVLAKLEQYQEALQSFDSAIAYNYNYATAWYNKSAVLVKLGRSKEALAGCDSALKFNPQLSQAVDLKNLILQEKKALP